MFCPFPQLLWLRFLLLLLSILYPSIYLVDFHAGQARSVGCTKVLLVFSNRSLTSKDAMGLHLLFGNGLEEIAHVLQLLPILGQLVHLLP